MSELTQIRKRRFDEFRKLQNSQQPGEEKLSQQVAQLEAMVKPIFTRDALERYGTIKAAFPERAVQLLVVMAQLIQQGKAKQVDDVLLKRILLQLTPKKRETQIRGI